MTAFKGLLLKDFYISRNWFFISLVGDIVFLAVPLGMGMYMDRPLMFMPIAFIMLLAFHVFFLPAMLLQMLHLEGKTQIWLHNPQSSRRLFTSKIIIGTLYQLVSQLLVTALGFITFQFVKHDYHFGTSFIFKLTSMFNIGILLFGLYLAAWVMFYWAVYHSLGKFPKIKSFRWLVLIVIFFGYNVLSLILSRIDFLKAIVTKWTLPIMVNQQFTFEQGSWEAEVSTAEFPVVMLILYTLLAIGLFLFSSWLLDRKVEV